MPISSAKAIGPARSPTVLLTPSACSANVEAHWLTACSLAPAHSIISKNTQNTLRRNSAGSAPPGWPSAGSVHSGTRANARPLATGSTAQARASHFHCAVPATAKNSVDTRTTPICPQQ